MHMHMHVHTHTHLASTHPPSTHTHTHTTDNISTKHTTRTSGAHTPSAHTRARTKHADTCVGAGAAPPRLRWCCLRQCSAALDLHMVRAKVG
jgi:hypothetical protein